MRETEKALSRLETDYLWRRIRREAGPKIDIGCGNCPIPGAMAWDMPQGDAQTLPGVAAEHFGLVWSSHSLEHMRDWRAALRRWLAVTRPGGVMWIIVPDFDLYEHGRWPSLYNPDHKHFFTVRTFAHWVAAEFPEARGDVLRLQLVDAGYDYAAPVQDQTLGPAEAAIEFVIRKR